MTEEVKRKLMRLARGQLSPIGQLVYDFCKSNGESRKECLINAIEAQDCFTDLKQAEEWIEKRSKIKSFERL